MGLLEHYNAAFADENGEQVQVKEGMSKEASSEAGEESDFGTTVAHYFNVGLDAFMDKIADEQPMASLGEKSSLGATLGNTGDPSMSVNRDASGDQPLKAAVGNTSPYDLQVGAAAKAILKKKVSSQAGDVGAYAQS